MNIKAKMQLQGVIRKLIESMELLNSIPEKDYAKIVKDAKKREKSIAGIRDNAERGNIFMVLFFTRELIESLLND